MLNFQRFWVCVYVYFFLPRPPLFLFSKESAYNLLQQFFSDIGIQQRMTSSGHSNLLMLCPKSGKGKACAVEPSCSQDTYLCPQEIVCQALFGFLIVCFCFFGFWGFFFTAIGDNVKCDTAIVHNLM